MIDFKIIWLSFILFLTTYSQNICAQNDTINRLDEYGLKTGNWIIFGKHRSYSANPKFKYCDTCKVETGIYEKGRKQGEWTEYYPTGEKWKVTNFVQNKPSGLAQEYYKNGNVFVEYELRIPNSPLAGLFALYTKDGDTLIYEPHVMYMASYYNEGLKERTSYKTINAFDSLQYQIILDPNEYTNTLGDSTVSGLQVIRDSSNRVEAVGFFDSFPTIYSIEKILKHGLKFEYSTDGNVCFIYVIVDYNHVGKAPLLWKYNTDRQYNTRFRKFY